MPHARERARGTCLSLDHLHLDWNQVTAIPFDLEAQMWHPTRKLLWLGLVALALTAACETGPTGICIDPTDSGGCRDGEDSTRVADVRAVE